MGTQASGLARPDAVMHAAACLDLARVQTRREKGKCEGRETHAEKRPGAVSLAKKLYRASPVTGKRTSLRKITAVLTEGAISTSVGACSIGAAAAWMTSVARQARLREGENVRFWG